MDSKYEFKWVYPSGRASMPWKANIYVRGDRKHEGVHCDSRILQEVNVLIQQEANLVYNQDVYTLLTKQKWILHL